MYRQSSRDGFSFKTRVEEVPEDFGTINHVFSFFTRAKIVVIIFEICICVAPVIIYFRSR